MKINQLKVGVILSYVTIALNLIIGIVYTPILIRSLGQSEYGLYSLVASVIGYLTILDLGFGNAITIYTARYRSKNEKEKEQKLHGMFFSIYVIIGIIAFLGAMILYFNVEKIFGNSLTILEIEKSKILMFIMAINLGITFAFSIYGSIITAYEKFIYQKLASIIRIILQPLIMLPILFLGGDSISLVIVITVLNIAILLSNMIYARKKLGIKFKFGMFDKVLLFEICGYSFYIFLNMIIDKINWNVDQFILGVVQGTSAVSIYSVAGQLNTMYLMFSTAIAGVLLPKVASMEENKASDEEFSDIFIKTGRIQYIVLMVIITGFILFGKQFIEMIWVGTEYVDSYLIACILMIPVTIPLIQNVGLSILQAKNKHRYRTIVFVFIALANVLISIPLSKLYSGTGAAIATAISLIVGQIIILNIYYWKKINLDIPKFWKEIIKMTVPIIFVAILGIIIKKIWIIDSILILILQIVIYTILYSFVVWNFSMNKYEKDIILKPISKIIKRGTKNDRN